MIKFLIWFFSKGRTTVRISDVVFYPELKINNICFFKNGTEYHGKTRYVLRNCNVSNRPPEHSALALRLLTENKISLEPDIDRIDVWLAESPVNDEAVEGPTPEVAICRAIIAMKSDTQP